jgi:2-iminobutanoate/2-iminopropanoate deaminase
MERSPHSTADAPQAIGPYSQAVLASGRYVFCSGQVALRPDGSFVEGSVAEQTRQALANLQAVLESAGSSLGLVVKTTVFLSTMEHFAAMNEEYSRHFPSPYPARSTIAVAGLPKGADVEIEAVALLPD